MEILRVLDIKCGEKCYIKSDGAIREAIFNGTRSGERIPCIMLEIAGIGNRVVEFPRFSQFENWYHGKTSYLPIFKTLEDVKSGNRMVGMYGTTDNCYNSRFMQPFFKHVSVCNCGGSNYAWWWNGIEPIRVFVKLPDGYVDDKDGFRFVGKFRIIGTPDNLLRIINREVEENELYMSSAECAANHTAKVVTF